MRGYDGVQAFCEYGSYLNLDCQFRQQSFEINFKSQFMQLLSAESLSLASGIGLGGLRFLPDYGSNLALPSNFWLQIQTAETMSYLQAGFS